jgi:hypothetical protein
VVDHLDLHASDFSESVRFDDGNNVEALYRDVGNPGHAG